MRTRKRWFSAGGALLAVALIATLGTADTTTVEDDTYLGLDTPDEYWVRGEIANLDVTISPDAIGGWADLYATSGGQTVYVMSFPLDAPTFPVTAPIPHLGDPADPIGFYYEAFTSFGFLGVSAVVEQPVLSPGYEVL